MANPFDHMPEFQALDPDTKNQIMTKYQTLSPEDQQTVMSKANTPMQLRASEGITETEGPITTALTLGVGGTQAGVEGLGVAARVGRNIVKTPERTIEAARAVGDLALEGVRGLGGVIGKAADAFKGTGAKAVANLTEKAAELPLKQAAKSEMAQGLRMEAKQGIQAAEEKVHLGLTDIQGDAKVLSPAFAAKAAKLADMGAETLASKMSSEALQTLRKTSDLGFKQGGADAPLYAKAKKVAADALGLQQPHIKEALSRYSEIEKVISELPASFKKEKATLKLALTKARNLAMEQKQTLKTTKELAKKAAVGAAAGLGFGVANKIIN